MTTYVVVYERAGDDSWSAYVPDIPGVVAAGDTRDQARGRISEALAIYKDELDDTGSELPAASATTGAVTV